LACQQVLLSQKRLIATHPNMRFPLESTAVQWVWDSQQALSKLKTDLRKILISKKTPQNAGAALGMVGSSPQLSGAADAMSSD